MMTWGKTDHFWRFRLGAVVFFLMAAFGGTLCAQAYDLHLVPGELTTVLDTGTSVLAADVEGDLLRASSASGEFSVVKNGDPGDAILAMEASGGTAIAVGKSGVVYRSTDDGQTWAEMLSPETAILGEWRDVASDGQERWVAVGVHQEQCAALVSDDDGETWALVDVGVEGHFRGIAWDAADGRFLAVGSDGFFDGLAYTSGNGRSWTPVELPEGVAPLWFVASDGAGGLLLGGESGPNGSLLIRDGETAGFTFVPGSSFSETLHSAAAVGAGEWVVGGANTLLIAVGVEGGMEVLGPPIPGGATIGTILFNEPQTLLVTGALPETGTPETSEARLSVALDEATGNLVLTLEGALADRSYRLETSTNLRDWTIVSGSERLAFGPVVEWTLTPAPEEQKRFWRATSD